MCIRRFFKTKYDQERHFFTEDPVASAVNKP